MILTRRHMLALGAAGLAAPGFAQDAPVVFAASSLKTVLDEIAVVQPMRLSYGGSGALARQIMLGAPADLFFSANAEWVRVVSERGLFAEPPLAMLSNRLVLVGAKGVSASLEDLPGAGRIAMGFVEAVPAGQYGKAALEALGIWNAVEKQVVQTENVRAALALVARGEVPFAVVYATDALAEPSVSVLAEFPEESHPPIRYELGVLSANGGALFDALQGDAAEAVYTKHGFGVL